MEVNERLKIFRRDFPGHALISDVIKNENGEIIIKATVYNDSGGAVATGIAHEKEGSSQINTTSYVENCETSAWGRALGNFGIGIGSAVASADEVKQAIKQQGGKPPTGKSMTAKQSEFIIKLGMGLKDPYSPLSKPEVVELVQWKAKQLGVDPKSMDVADAFLPRRDETIKPWDKFAKVFDEWMDWKMEQGQGRIPIFDEQGNEVKV